MCCEGEGGNHTRIRAAEAYSPKLLKRNTGLFGEQNDIPILVPHGGVIEDCAYTAKALI